MRPDRAVLIVVHGTDCYNALEFCHAAISLLKPDFVKDLTMKWLTERKLSTKLGLAFAAVLVMTAFVGLFSINQLAKVNDTATDLSSRWMPAMRVIQDIKSQIARVRTRELQYIISDDVADLDKYDKVIANDLVELKKMQDDVVKLIKTPEEQAMYDEFLSLWDRYMAEDAKLRAAVRA